MKCYHADGSTPVEACKINSLPICNKGVECERAEGRKSNAMSLQLTITMTDKHVTMPLITHTHTHTHTYAHTFLSVKSENASKGVGNSLFWKVAKFLKENNGVGAALRLSVR